MKNATLLILAVFISLCTVAQVPQGISYQAIAFNAGGTAVTNANVGVRISILDNSATGTVVYSEVHTKATNAQGLFNLVIGMGSPVSGTFAAINWSVNSKFLKVEIDPAGGTNYTSVGSNQLMSVPFALTAASLSSSGSNSILDQVINAKTSNMAFNDDAANKVYAYCTATGIWTGQAYLSSSSSVSIESIKGNFYFNDYSANKLYVFNAKTGIWSAQSYTSSSSSISIRLDSLSGNCSFNDYSASTIYSYSVSKGTWSPQVYASSSSSITLIPSKGNLAFNDYSANKVYAYSSASGTWSSQNYTSSSSSITINQSNGNFYFNDYSSSKIYIFSGKIGAWTSQPYTSSSSSVSLIISTIE